MARPALFICLILLLLNPAIQAEERCGDAADKALFRVESWDALGAWWERYPECDDGYFAEHLSELVTTWLEKSPASITRLGRAAVRHPRLMKNAMRHIDTLASQQTTVGIRHNAERRCPDGDEATCASIIKALDALDAELARQRRARE